MVEDTSVGKSNFPLFHNINQYLYFVNKLYLIQVEVGRGLV